MFVALSLIVLLVAAIHMIEKDDKNGRRVVGGVLVQRAALIVFYVFTFLPSCAKMTCANIKMSRPIKFIWRSTKHAA